MTALLQKMTSRASHSHHSTSIAQTPLPTDGGGWSDPRCSPSCCWGVLVFQRPPTAPAPSRSRIRLGALGSPSSAPLGCSWRPLRRLPSSSFFYYQLFIQILGLLRQALSKYGVLKLQPNGGMLTKKKKKMCKKLIQLEFLPIHELAKQSPIFTSLIFTRLFWFFKAVRRRLDATLFSSRLWH